MTALDLAAHYLDEVRRQSRGHKRLAEGAMAQLEDKDFFVVLDAGATAIGAVIGAAAGTGVQAVTKRAPAQLRAESTLSFRLETPLTLQPAQSVDPNSSQDSSLSG